MKKTGLMAILLLWLAGSLAGSVKAAPLPQTPSPVLLQARLGLDGYCRNQTWLPVRVKVENNGPDLEARLVAGSPGQTSGQTVYPISLPNTSRKEVTLLVYPDTYLTSLRVSLFSGNEEIASAQDYINCLTPGDLLYGVVSDNPSAFAVIGSIKPASGNATVAYLSMAELPESGQALGALNYLVISNTDTGSLTDAQRQAIGDWVASGGILLITGGPAWQKTAAGLGDLLPAAVNGTADIQELSPLRDYVESLVSNSALSSTLAAKIPDITGGALAATATPTEGAEVLVSSGQAPLLIHKPRGLGDIYYLSADPALEPLKNWDGMEYFYQSLLVLRRDQPNWAHGIADWGNAQQAAQTIPSLNLPSAWLICGLLALYLVIIGPLNSLALRLLKRRELGWITIPALVVVFSLGMFLFGRILRGNQPVLNRLAVVSVQPGLDRASISGVVGVFSPIQQIYQAAVPNGMLIHTPPNNVPILSSSSGVLQTGSKMALTGLDVEIGGISSFAVEGTVSAPAFTSQLRLSTVSGSVQIEGDITNASPLTLHNTAFLAPGSNTYLNDWKPGESKHIQISLSDSQPAGSGSYPGPMVKPGPSGVYVAPPYYPSYPYGNTALEGMMGGTTSYYDNKEVYRRYSLVNSILTPNMPGTTVNSLGNALYISGWSDDTPLGVTLTAGADNKLQRVRTEDQTLYLIALQPLDELANQGILPPAMFVWSVLEASNYGNTSPYNSDLIGSATYMFQLARPFAFHSVKSLTLHVDAGGSSNLAGIDFFLWNYRESYWAQLPQIQADDTEIPDPGQFVGPGGEIRLRIQNVSNPGSLHINRADFTLEVEP